MVEDTTARSDAKPEIPTSSHASAHVVATVWVKKLLPVGRRMHAPPSRVAHVQHFEPHVLPRARLNVLGVMGNIITESPHALLPQETRDELVVCPSLSDLDKTRGTIVAADKRFEIRALTRTIASSFPGKIWFKCAPRRIRVVVGHV